jgi:hypothetical protein
MLGRADRVPVGARPPPQREREEKTCEPFRAAPRWQGKEIAMQLQITHGPTKADLLRSVTNVGEGLTTTFETTDGLLKAQIERLDEGANGVDFTIAGTLEAPDMDVPFTASYNIEEKTGTLSVTEPGP